jgi:hypothetical protein
VKLAVIVLAPSTRKGHGSRAGDEDYCYATIAGPGTEVADEAPAAGTMVHGSSTARRDAAKRRRGAFSNSAGTILGKVREVSRWYSLLA